MKLHKTLYLKFLLIYLIFGALCFILTSTVTSGMILRDLTETQAESLYKESQLVAVTYGTQIYSGDDARKNALNQLKAIDTYISAEIRIIDSRGKQILDSREDTESNPREFPDFDPTTSSGKYYVTGDFYGTYKEQTLSVFYPITSNYKVIGYVIINTPMSSLYASRDRILNISYLTMLLLYLLSLLILLVFTFAVYRPLGKITKAAEEYAKGHMDYKLMLQEKDEMGYLAGTLNFMASEIARSEDNQKKFIANVSHDFRSPLTSIRGYLTAMMDGTIPPEMYEKYLGILINE